MILYGAPISPFVRKVSVFAAEKGLELQEIATGIGDTNPDFLSCSPFKKMPGFSDGDFKISDSSAIITYIEAKHPQPALLPADPANRARTIWYDEFVDTILFVPAAKIFFNRVVAPKFLGRDGDEDLAKLGESELPAMYDYLEGVIPASGFLVADQMTLADISVTCVFVNLSLAGIHPEPKTYPKLASYIAAICARPSFAARIARERKMVGLA